jgi:hypothetical protein
LVANANPQSQPAVPQKPPVLASAPRKFLSEKAFHRVDSLAFPHASNEVALLFVFSFADNHRQGKTRRSANSTFGNPAAAPATGGY